MKRNRVLILALLGIIGLLAILAQALVLPALSREPVVTVTVKVSEGALTPNTVTIPVNQPVRLVLENEGAFPHEVAFYGLSATIRDRAPQSNAHYGAKAGGRGQPTFILRASGGKSDWIELVATQPGSYEMACDLVGHKEMGMLGQLIVGDARRGNS
ncbi:MAG TPA: cupredoxin domain-containing protein [Alphaproteobacteria bacterium]|jgi:uncharacterized cupredoxin-like copper-binding protein|nr:cupredoxin domain-containing protein [Alphaproteobacteria bacterium]